MIKAITLILSGLAWISAAIFVLGILLKLVSYFRSPEPFKIPLTPGPETTSGVWLKRMLPRLLFFTTLIQTRFWLWLGAWGFHLCFLLVILRHLRYFMYPVPWWVMIFQTAGIYAGWGLLFFSIYLLGYRISSDRGVYLSTLEDYIVIALFIGIAGTGLGLKFVDRLYLIEVKAFSLGLVSFNPTDPPLNLLFILHFLLVILLLAYFPYGKLLHAVGTFINPTLVQRDDVRLRRHINPWDFEVS